MSGPVLPRERTMEALELLVKPGDPGREWKATNQKQADFLSRSLVKVDPKKVHDLHLIISSITRPEHLTLFESGIAKEGGFSPSRDRRACEWRNCLKTGAGDRRRSHVRLNCTPGCWWTLFQLVLVCAEQADQQGICIRVRIRKTRQVIVEAAAFHDGIVIRAGGRIVDKLPTHRYPT